LSIIAFTPAGAADLTAEIDADYAYLDALYKHFHQNPEISFQEKESAARLVQELSALGFEVTDRVGGYGIVAVMKNGAGPTVMLRADMDALPVKEQSWVDYPSLVTTIDDAGNEVSVMHACGHDVHMTVFVGTARRLAAMKDKWSGTLVMIGQPAEERGAGARAMLEDGLFKRFPRPDYNVALHTNPTLPAGTIGYVSGWALANVDSVDITVRGIGGHGAYPHMTKDPVVIASQIVMALQTIVSREINPQSPAVITVGSIHGGTKHNIISNEVKLQLTVRSYSDDVRDQLLGGIRRVAANVGRVAGLPEDLLPVVIHQKDEYTPSTYNDPDLTARLVAAIGGADGGPETQRTGPVMGGEDFSRYGRQEPKIPSVMFWLGGVDPMQVKRAQAGKINLPSLHSPLFAPVPEPTLKGGVHAMTTAALELLAKP
jgi:hippurate hydrolase